MWVMVPPHFMTDDVIVGLPLLIDDGEPLVVNSLNLLALTVLEIGASGSVSILGNLTLSSALLRLRKSASISIGGHYNVGDFLSDVELWEAEFRMLNPSAPLTLVPSIIFPQTSLLGSSWIWVDPV